MAVTTDPTSPVGMIRTIITDLDQDAPLFGDEQLQAFLALHDGGIRRAAAAALDTIATSEALVSKRIKTLDLSTDGPAVAQALRAHAEQLRDEDDNEWGIEVVNFDPYAAYRPREL